MYQFGISVGSTTFSWEFCRKNEMNEAQFVFGFRSGDEKKKCGFVFSIKKLLPFNHHIANRIALFFMTCHMCSCVAAALTDSLIWSHQHFLMLDLNLVLFCFWLRIHLVHFVKHVFLLIERVEQKGANVQIECQIKLRAQSDLITRN